MFDFQKFTKDVLNCKNQDSLDKYLESCFIELEGYLESLSISQIDKMKFDIEDFLLDMLDAKLITKENSKMINSFLILLAQKLELSNLVGIITEILHYLPNSAIKNRLEASKLYLRVNNIAKDYHSNFEQIVELISSTIHEDEYRYKKINAILNFYMTAMKSFARVNNGNLAESFQKLFILNSKKYELLNDDLVVDVVNMVSVKNYATIKEEIFEKISNNKPAKIACKIQDNSIIQKENSDYSKKLYAMTDPTFAKIRQVSFDYIESIGDPDELFTNLQRGQAIIEDKNLLYKYLVSFGEKHKAKLYSSFEKIEDKLKNERFNIIDWGCGQAFGIMMLLEFAKERNINLNISDICLIEPSKLALSRGLLHIDVFKTADYNVKAINTDIDCLKDKDFSFENGHKTLHIFSNILDVENFNLDKAFLKKISTNIKNDNLFVCVSPNINDKRNGRIDLFYRYFDENFNTELISARDTNIGKNKRYEKVFEVKYAKEEEVAQSRQEVEKNKSTYLNVFGELKSYQRYITPILELEEAEETLDKDPEYLIFKIRKVAEVITSKIYSNYETDNKNVSFNDMIRYLSFEKHLFNKKITSNLHTIRTIGNINVHEHDQAKEIQKLDANLMLISLLILLKELEYKKEL
jgi:hypothetical protein